jgi:hypothetical protein
MLAFFCGVSPTVNLNKADEGECEDGNKSRKSVHRAFFLYVLLYFLRDMHVQINSQMNINEDKGAQRVTFQKHISVSQWRQKRKPLGVITLETGLLCVVRIGCGRSRWPVSFKAYICGRSLAGNAGSNPADDMNVGLL